MESTAAVGLLGVCTAHAGPRGRGSDIVRAPGRTLESLCWPAASRTPSRGCCCCKFVQRQSRASPGGAPANRPQTERTHGPEASAGRATRLQVLHPARSRGAGAPSATREPLPPCPVARSSRIFAPSRAAGRIDAVPAPAPCEPARAPATPLAIRALGIGCADAVTSVLGDCQAERQKKQRGSGRRSVRRREPAGDTAVFGACGDGQSCGRCVCASIVCGRGCAVDR